MRRINLSALADDQPVAAAIIERSGAQNGVGTGSARSVNIAYLLSGIPMSALGQTRRAAERALRGLALGRKAWLFAGSDRGGQRAALLYSLIVTAKLNDVDPQAWLAHVLHRTNQHP